MAAVVHVKSNPIPDMTGAVTVFGSDGLAQTVAASQLVRPSDWNSAHNQLLTLAGNTAGVSSISGTNIVLAGGANITLSASQDVNAATVSIVGGAGPGGGLTNINVSAGATSQNLSALVFSNANGLAFGLSGSTVTGSYTVPAQSVQPALQSLSAGTTRITTGEIVFSNSNGVSFGVNGQTITATVKTDYLTTARASNDAAGLATAQTNVTWTVDSRGISLNAGGYAGTGFTSTTTAGTDIKATQASNGLSIAAPAFLTTAMASNAATISNIRVSAGTTSNLLSALTFGDGNGVSFGINASTVTASHNGLTSQSNQNVTAANGGFAFQTLSFSNANGVSFGTSAGSAITASHNGLTTARASNDALGLNTAQSNVTWTANSSGLSIDARGYAGTGTTFNGANVSGSMTVNSNGVQLSLSAGAGGGVTPVASASNGSFSFTTLAFSNANNVTFGTSAGSIITASVAPPGAAAENNWVNLLGANTAGNTTASGSTIGYSGINLTLSGTNGSVVNISAPATSSLSATGLVSIATNGSTISIGVPSGFSRSYFKPFDGYVQVTGNQGQGTYHMQHVEAPNLVFDRVVMPIFFSGASNSTATVSYTALFGIYSRNASTLSLSASASTTGTINHSGNNNSSLYNGMRLLTLGLTTTMTEGEYWAGIMFRTSTAGANATLAQALVSQQNSNFSGMFGVASNATVQMTRGFGHFTASTASPPGSVAFSQINGTASIALRQPAFFLVSNTF